MCGIRAMGSPLHIFWSNHNFSISLIEVRVVTLIHEHSVSQTTYLNSHIHCPKPELWLLIYLLARSNFTFTGEKSISNIDQSVCFYFILPRWCVLCSYWCLVFFEFEEKEKSSGESYLWLVAFLSCSFY